MEFGYLYTIVLDAPRRDSSRKYIPRESQSVDVVNGNIELIPNPYVPYSPPMDGYIYKPVQNVVHPNQGLVSTSSYGPGLSRALS